MNSGDPLSLLIALTKYKTILGLLVRDFIPIRYKKWIGKDNDPWRVSKSEKDYIWDIKDPRVFHFPNRVRQGASQEKNQKKSWGHASRISMGHCTSILSSKIKSQISMVDSLASRRTSSRILRNTGYPRST
jgi:hypothetical protein